MTERPIPMLRSTDFDTDFDFYMYLFTIAAHRLNSSVNPGKAFNTLSSFFIATGPEELEPEEVLALVDELLEGTQPMREGPRH